ncbi:MAG: protein phosphatase 2C domain-containing protein [Gemmataceae bacterium]|nr:protein phosphatase 2C domain-containing protein [Gemmataceae bacterium]
MKTFVHAGLSHCGQVRPHNEDRWFADSTLGLIVVADGMGGAIGGEQAAQLVVDALPPLVRRTMRGVRSLADALASTRMRECLATVSAQILAESRKHPYMEGMGAAVVCALIWEHKALLAHLGDSRAYLFHEGALEQITRDHSRVQMLLDRGEITAEQAARHPAAGHLLRFAGMSREAPADVCVRDLVPGDQVLLCSDGLTSMLGEDEIQGILHLEVPLAQKCALLVDTANLLGGDDNITVVMAAIE